ncbi:uncharacterized protein K452DRAFT_98156 [Aplosporella prunicola CBS 121167]|uniref:Uncharacterized protein n=1 Tax=Aplosporella prunicola CBS 121167 TaxID=1176127 RepID=A0A6A6B3H3_9PEZI|nr:uncharacterized protein K452DRAFT_98156 [Aplosporella prunicola CBS 121167]KAF2137764.1 hypothetical protein K452DRAFT_98156 [Aplosporella prunicola CBS 121167]
MLGFEMLDYQAIFLYVLLAIFTFFFQCFNIIPPPATFFMRAMTASQYLYTKAYHSSEVDLDIVYWISTKG